MSQNPHEQPPLTNADDDPVEEFTGGRVGYAKIREQAAADLVRAVELVKSELGGKEINPRTGEEL